MKSIFTFLSLFFLLLSFSTSAQRSFQIDEESRAIFLKPEQVAPAARVSADTLLFPTFSDTCSLTVFAYTIDRWGFLAGTNGYLDREKSQFVIYENEIDALEVTEAFFFFSHASVVGDGEMRAKIYSVAADEGPLDLLGTSQPVRVSEVLLDPGFAVATSFLFDTPVQVPSNNVIHVSLDFSDLYATNDTVNIFTTAQDCGSGSNTWEFWDNETWNDFLNAWSLNADIMAGVAVNVDNVSTLNEPIQQNGITLNPVFPNPAAENVQIRFELDRTETLFLEVYQYNGARILQSPLGRMNAGSHSHELKVGDLPNGLYLIALSNGKERLTTGLSVMR